MFSRCRINFNSIPIKITLYMVAVLITTAALILIITNRHFNEQTKRYHEDILNRKERAVLTSIDYLLDSYPGKITTDNVIDMLGDRILEITDINKLPIVIYNLKGEVELSTQAEDPKYNILPQNILDSLAKNDYYKELIVDTNDKRSHFSSFSYIKDINSLQNVAIVSLPYETNNLFLQDDKSTLMGSYGLAFIVILLLGAIMIYVVSNNTFKKLSTFADRIKETEVISNNIPIQYDKNDEIRVLVDAYNEMLIKLKEQSELLANIERQEAWREFARQVAHEIKNPLTPMKLMIQSYMRKFSTNDEELNKRTYKTAEILMQQIDTIEAIADAFSDFAKMPNRKDEMVDVVEIIGNTLQLYPLDHIQYTYSQPKIEMMFDKQYLNRIVTNLVKNAFQAIPNGREPKVSIDLKIAENQLILSVEDNGIGIAEEQYKEIFKPRFTTKRSGTGIGLSMVKKIVEDYDGLIYFESIEEVGTKFIIKFPYKNESKTI